ncbi:MAG: hypothetical protein WCK00_16515, partial [Deltaproteobacteria bacterium]
MHPKTRFRRPAAESPDRDGILALAASLNELHRRMAAECVPIVQDIIQSRSRDHQQIEHVLDHLLGCACIPEGLTLFRSLCRYYFTLNPIATANYIVTYREMWDNEN